MIRPGPRGYAGRGGGSASFVEAAPEWRSTTVQACGLNPFIAGSGAPMVGVPLGHDIFSGSTVACDPISWFARAQLISNPSVMVLGRPGLGKSSVVCRMALGLAGYGVLPLVFGDLKPDYAELIQALGGNVVSLGRGQGTLNVLDPGAAVAAAQRLTGQAKRKLVEDSIGRRLNMLGALVGLNRQGLVTDTEESILSAAMRVLDEHHAPGDAVLGDLIQVIAQGPDVLRRLTLAMPTDQPGSALWTKDNPAPMLAHTDTAADDTRYREATHGIHASLLALCEGALGDTFAQKTTVAISLDAPLCIDISSIGEADAKLQAAVLLACWSEGFAAIAAAQALADAGLEPQRRFFIVLDELWRVLRAGRGLVDRVDALTRLNRAVGVGLVMVTHTMADLVSLPDPADAMKAKGFAERAGFIIAGGLPASELPALEQIVALSEKERRLVTEWASPPAWDPGTGQQAAPPGRGKFLIKVGGRPGIAVDVQLTPAELQLHDTNRRWAIG